MDYSHDIESARKAMEARYKDIVAKKSYNLEQWRNFFNAIYSYNNQQELLVIGSLSSRGAV